jgi:hypothetical protein
MIYAIYLMIAAAGPYGASQPPQPPPGPLPLVCDPALTALFTPRSPQLGHYEVCTSPEPLPAAAERIRHTSWNVESLPPLDAFGTGGSYNRAALSRLFRGQRPSVARGWIQEDGRFESLTLISPYPARSLDRLVPGTLIIRFIICCT